MTERKVYLQEKYSCYTTKEYGKYADSLESIARIHNLPLEDVVLANPNVKDGTAPLPPNRDVLVPILSERFVQAKSLDYYVVHTGDSFPSIAKKLNLNIIDLVKSNPHIIHGFILPGERLFLLQRDK